MKAINHFRFLSLIGIVMSMLLAFSAISNADEKKFSSDITMPQYKGGQKAMEKFISQNLKYPAEAQKRGIQGKVIISFGISKEGNIINPKVVEGIGHGCDKEALRVVKKMPKWKPGKDKEGNIVIVYMKLPIHFRLQ